MGIITSRSKDPYKPTSIMESRKGLFSWLTFMLMNILMHIFTLREAFASLASLVSADFFWEALCWGELINYHFTCQEDLFRELILARKLVLGEQLVWAKHDLSGTSFWAEYDFLFFKNFGGLFERESHFSRGTVTSGAALFLGVVEITSRSAWLVAFQIASKLPMDFLLDFQKTRSRSTTHRLTP